MNARPRCLLAAAALLGAPCLWAASAGVAVPYPEPGFTLSRDVDWISGTLNVEITRTLDVAVPSLEKAKSEAETDIDERLVDFLLRAAGGLTVDSSHSLDDLLGADAGLHTAVSALAQQAPKAATFLAPDFTTLVERFAVPFWGPRGIAQPFFPTRATPIRTVPGEVATRAWTGVLIDARGYLPAVGMDQPANLQPALFPRIWDERMNLVMDRSACDPQALQQWGMVGYARTPDDDAALIRAGTLPLRLAARAVFGEKATDVVISADGARQILELPENVALLRAGKVVIIYGSAVP